MTFQNLSVTFPSLSFPEPLPEVHNIYEASTLFIIPLILDSLDINEQHDYDCIIIFSWIKFYHEIGLFSSFSLSVTNVSTCHTAVTCHVSRGPLLGRVAVLQQGLVHVEGDAVDGEGAGGHRHLQRVLCCTVLLCTVLDIVTAPRKNTLNPSALYDCRAQSSMPEYLQIFL